MLRIAILQQLSTHKLIVFHPPPKISIHSLWTLHPTLFTTYLLEFYIYHLLMNTHSSTFNTSTTSTFTRFQIRFSSSDVMILKARAARESDPLAPYASSMLNIIGSSKVQCICFFASTSGCHLRRTRGLHPVHVQSCHDCIIPLIAVVFKSIVKKIKENTLPGREAFAMLKYIETVMIPAQWRGDPPAELIMQIESCMVFFRNHAQEQTWSLSPAPPQYRRNYTPSFEHWAEQPPGYHASTHPSTRNSLFPHAQGFEIEGGVFIACDTYCQIFEAI